MKILLLSAGTNEQSNSLTLAEAFCRGATKAGNVEIEGIRVAEFDLAHFTLAHYDAATDQGDAFRRLERAVTEAAGVVIATPIWNFSVPAHLKNLIDRMGAFALDRETRSKGTLGGKPFFFLYTGGAPLPAWKGLMRFTTMHLPESIRYFGGSVFGRLFEGKCTPGKGAFGLVVDKRADVLARAEAAGERFARRTARFAQDGTLPLSIRIVTWFYKKGQRIIAKF